MSDVPPILSSNSQQTRRTHLRDLSSASKTTLEPFDTTTLIANDAALSIADQSPLVSYFWKDRGLAPRSYIRGMAVGFAEASRQLASGAAALQAATAPLDSNHHDALAWYRPELTAASTPLDDTPASRLVGIFTIMIGLGMRESSGQHCVGLDPDAVAPPTAMNAEAGLFQVSCDSLESDPLLPQLFHEYRGRKDLLDVFSTGIRCDDQDWRNVPGQGDGEMFQFTMKTCPMFAMLYTAVLLRCSRRHWGPLNRREVECSGEAVDMFGNIARGCAGSSA